ncbi:MAG: Branched-chain amino acid transport system permease protein LivM [Hydrogenibacillus schlegelii]|uniref:Branched-chain amino acid transport system permease protein LivM n=1 Tax=Hydrogenibacillus schlegelii TaxID=1484 RepID=A0A2T5GFS3_HYDSH|nr:branched-chain amino acid ABC transporter permease [Hydrogenibacillus schlegelii]PTQ55010.1 MAG: Branched-chain amino acid transport system permease protein LivM [Hydrogenibacillus schlegelii]
MDWLNPYQLQVLSFVFLNGILALSVFLTLATGQLSLGQAGFMSIGAYTAAILTGHAGMPMIVAVPAGAVLAGAVALIIGGPTLRLHGLYLAIATLGFGEVVRVVMLNLEVTGGALGLKGLPSLGGELYRLEQTLGLTTERVGLTPSQLKALSVTVFLFLLLLLVVVLLARLMRSRVGRAFSAIRADEVAAEAMGIDLRAYKLLAFVLGAVLAGFGGGLYAHLTTAITPDDFNYHRVVEMLSFAVIGGAEVFWGPLVGALLLTALPELLRALQDYKMMFYGVAMLVVMIVRPRGLITEDLLFRFRRRRFSAGGRALEG